MASPKAGPFSVVMNNVAVTAARTLIQLQAGAASSIEILKVWVSQSNTTVSAQQRIQIHRKVTAFSTVTSATPAPLGGGAAADAQSGTTATGTNASAEGAGAETVLYADTFNVLNGWLYVPVPEERIIVPPALYLGIKFPTDPAISTTYTCGVIFQELG